MKDLQKRRRIMARSMALGHCICDPKKPCPCDLLKQKDLCLCAGETPEMAEGPIRLTQLVTHAGCASKIDQAALKKALGGLTFQVDSQVLIGVPAGDDAGVYRISESSALVQTVDIFTPSVDDPYLFGQIAAANSVSDIYAMGGRPLTALSILGFPIHSVPDRVMRDILRGGIDKMREAGVSIIGGHSINDNEIKAGFAVTGMIDPSKILANSGARPGDVLILTKPLGTGIVSFAAQIGRAEPAWLNAAGISMATLNKTAADIMTGFNIHACTDITGFGLIGHLANIGSASGMDIEITWDDLSLLPGVLECLAQGITSGGAERNRDSCQEAVVVGRTVQPAMMDLCYDPQTSGGLLIVVPSKDAAPLLTELHRGGLASATVIGKVMDPGTGKIFVRSTGRRMIPSTKETHMEIQPSQTAEANPSAPCCTSLPTETPSASTGETQRKFQEFMKGAFAPGALDARTKQAVAIALCVLSKCEPCAKIHIAKAREMGFTQEQIDEAAWMAIAFGGSPLMMFYNGIKKG